MATYESMLAAELIHCIRCYLDSNKSGGCARPGRLAKDSTRASCRTRRFFHSLGAGPCLRIA